MLEEVSGADILYFLEKKQGVMLWPLLIIFLGKYTTVLSLLNVPGAKTKLGGGGIYLFMPKFFIAMSMYVVYLLLLLCCRAFIGYLKT